MFDNLFVYFGPIWSAAALLSIVLVLFAVAAVQTLRLALASARWPQQVVIAWLEWRQRLASGWAASCAARRQRRR